MTAVAFSGSHTGLPDGHGRLVADVVRTLCADTYITGGANGIDTICAVLAIAFYPGARHIICVPDGEQHNADLVLDLIGGGWNLEIVHVSGGYLARNQAMVDRADRLVAFPKTAKPRVRGSGTWHTIRRAQAKGIPVDIYPLKGAAA